MVVHILTPMEVEAILGDYEMAIKESNSIIEELSEVLNRLGACWEGETFYSYLVIYNRYKDIVQEQLNLLMVTCDETRNAMLALMPPPPPMHFDF